MKLREIKPYSDLHLTPIDTKYFRLSETYICDFITDEGTIRLTLKSGWITDLRSGCDLINPIIPKWGDKRYTACIILHDSSFSGWLSFDLANDLLRQGLILSGEIGSLRASMVYYAVSKFGKSHYYSMDDELPEPYTCNRIFEKIEWLDR